jgi:hypothetical protein
VNLLDGVNLNGLSEPSKEIKKGQESRESRASSLFELPEEIRKKQEKLSELEMLYQQRLRKTARTRARLENKQVLKMGNLWRRVNMLWPKNDDIALGMLLEQRRKFEAKPDYFIVWENLGKEFRESEETANHKTDDTRKTGQPQAEKHQTKKEEINNGRYENSAANSGNAS